MKPFLKFNIGVSNKYQTIKEEADKIELALKYGVEYISSVSVEKSKIHEMWELINSYKLENTTFCSVPIYESVLLNEPIMETIYRQYNKGVRSFVLNCAPRYLIEKANADKEFRINSRSGYFLTEYFKKNSNEIENPHLKHFAEIENFNDKHKDTKFVFSTVLRPGSGKDGNVKYLLEELQYYNDNNVMDGYLLEVGGHIKFNNFKKIIKALNKRRVSIMGPLITDATNKYDHITNIMGQHLFASLYKNVAGLLVISPAEHLHLPTLEDDKIALEYAKIVQHEIGLMYKDKECLKIESEFNNKTFSCNIKKNLFGEIKDVKPCDMCGDYCPLLRIKK